MSQDATPQDYHPNSNAPDKTPWYHGVTSYQWMVLAIASAGWVFDVFEGQLFGSCMKHALPVLLKGTAWQDYQETVINYGLAMFLAGGAVGGLLFGMLADRWGRKWTMAITILMYSVFTGLTALSWSWEMLIGLRFFVGMGVGGEWAVAAAIVAEVFPKRARPAASGIFHASSVLGTYLAVGALLLVGALTAMLPEDGWRFGFLLGVLPALLILWVRVGVREPESWQAAKQKAAADTSHKLGRVTDLASSPTLLRNTIIATSLAIIGLATFWGSHFRGRELVRMAADKQLPAVTQSQDGKSNAELVQQRKTSVTNYAAFGWFLVTTGGGLGLLSFAPLSQWIGRRFAFVVFHAGGFVFSLVVFFLADSLTQLLLILPVFGFFTLGMHAGYAVYFPELYPTRLRSTGTGFCFNMARVVVIPVLLLFAWLQDGPWERTLVQAMLILSSLFLVGIVLALLAPETRGQELPE